MTERILTFNISKEYLDEIIAYWGKDYNIHYWLYRVGFGMVFRNGDLGYIDVSQYIDAIELCCEYDGKLQKIIIEVRGIGIGFIKWDIHTAIQPVFSLWLGSIIETKNINNG